MKALNTLCLAVGALGLSGCQLTNQEHISHSFDDPVSIHDYQLPIYPDGMTLISNYRQRRNQDVWYWSELENKTYQRGENLIIQIVTNQPIEAPPAQFAFSLPNKAPERKYNDIGPYQRWVNVMPNGDKCTYAQQHTRKIEKWLSVFIHYCTPENQDGLTWLDDLKPSFYLQEF
ncbi:hypothetical protein ACQKPX_20180 [Photobacterium sp. DNB23_23_1]|uniref:Lipoprotein n=1 Tax=Photobacterium pectinilyticum TaxID=2906793 RepID=A0ABT1N6F4_9GAMM|nr:hypothetical protein [Photobacterium sp. ZSDE20]MCQ1059291.1 hypothetical protein [Photobacterium sp. ZSDE20]MDD1824748.1 hypothetical protein [Photobacterium sp. ZSDE20]